MGARGGEPKGVVCTRDGIVESFHRVHVVAVEGETVVATHGDGGLTVVYRSAAKPFQALPLVEDGVVGRYAFTDAELALAAASHNGEDLHLAGVRSILAKVGLGEEALGLGPLPPLSTRVWESLLKDGGEILPVHNNCSGQHAALLGWVKAQGYSLPDYLRATHPLQERIREIVAAFTDIPAGRLQTCPDGCGMLAFAVPLETMALSFARLASRSRTDEGPRRVLGAMAAHPFMVAGTGRLCTALAEVTGGRILGKLGAEGVYGLVIPHLKMGIALKVEDGHRRALDPAVIRVLDDLGLLSPAEAEALERFRWRRVRNTLGAVVGEIRATFHLGSARSSPPPR